MMTGLFVCAWLILWLAPDTSLGRLLQRWVLDRPIERATGVTRGQMILTVLLLTVAGGAVWVLQQEAAPLLGLATPEIGYLFARVEVTTWLDAVTGVLLVTAGVCWRGLKLPFFSNRGPSDGHQHRTTRTTRRNRVPTNDDERSISVPLAKLTS